MSYYMSRREYSYEYFFLSFCYAYNYSTVFRLVMPLTNSQQILLTSQSFITFSCLTHLVCASSCLYYNIFTVYDTCTFGHFYDEQYIQNTLYYWNWCILWYILNGFYDSALTLLYLMYIAFTGNFPKAALHKSIQVLHLSCN